jgi:hypothetical protein
MLHLVIPRETEAPSTRGVTEDVVVSNISLALDVAEKLAGFFQTSLLLRAFFPKV